jgi:hypothetical protein
MHDLVGLYRFAVRSGNRPLASELAPILCREPDLHERADRELAALSRGPARWSPTGECIVACVLERLAGIGY